MQSIMGKESEIDDMELQLQRAKAQLQKHEGHGSLDLTRAISSANSTQGSAFMARTHSLLGHSQSGRLSKRHSELSSLSENRGADPDDDVSFDALDALDALDP